MGSDYAAENALRRLERLRYLQPDEAVNPCNTGFVDLMLESLYKYHPEGPRYDIPKQLQKEKSNESLGNGLVRRDGDSDSSISATHIARSRVDG